MSQPWREASLSRSKVVSYAADQQTEPNLLKYNVVAW